MGKYLTLCPKCKGEKFYYNLAWQKWFEETKKSEEYLKTKFNTLLKEGVYSENEYDIFVEKEIPPPNEPEEIDCPECDAEGMIPTQEGNDVLELIRKFL